ncbi:hypothetical protein [Schleiferilactobacillus shenzhenensis]|uniref:Uncharacterized protein n=1 Tax=Schleiferilactobacillus shenzhenensis LY-73 TaxID=1231336 RepID=U4TN70_9LACO|nr:hypothetical protein [Schleiferilactobacillus shenzhenensis]ERL64860.1 hypothetical protein L248_0464 [Schleiferilactobacillus shenzhenensis LY-73]
MFNKTFRKLLLALSIVIGILLTVPSGQLAKADADSMTDLATSAFSNSSAYKKVFDRITSQTPQIVKPIFDANGDESGEMLVYSYSTKATSKITSHPAISGQFTTEVLSPLTVFYDRESNEITHVVLLDYAAGAKSQKAIPIMDFVTGQQNEITPDEAKVDTETLARDVQNRQSILLKDAVEQQQTADSNRQVSSSMSPTQGKQKASPNSIVTCQIFTCTAYASGGGRYDETCNRINDWVCGGMPKFWAYVVCTGVEAWGCYVPKYKVCVNGYWTAANVCPTMVG